MQTPVFSDTPRRNTTLVLIGQYTALVISFLVEDAIWESLLQCFIGFDDKLRNQGISFIWWLISNLMRFFEGMVSICVIFVLIVTSNDIVSLFKDFTAMTFISSLDNIFFSCFGRCSRKDIKKCDNSMF